MSLASFVRTCCHHMNHTRLTSSDFPFMCTVYAASGICRAPKCGRQTRPTSPFGPVPLYCDRHSDADLCGNDSMCTDLLNSFDEVVTLGERTPITCAAPSCSTQVVKGSQFFPACRKECRKMLELIKNNAGDFNAQLDALGEHHARASIQDASWDTYKSGIRMWMRFRLGVQRRHPSQIDGSHPDGTPKLERDAEQQLIRFVEWLGHAGTLAPAQRAGYVSAVKAAHLLWFGYPYESFSHTKFFRLTRVLDGMIKQHKGAKLALREGMLRNHFKRIFQYIDDVFKDPADIYFTRPMEALLITMWQGIFRPDECVPTQRNQEFAHMGQVVFRGPSGAPVPYHTPYAKVNYCEYDPDGRKNDPGRTNPPVILAADHAADSKRFSACFQLHALFNLVKPNAAALATFPLFPTRAQGPNFSPYTYEGLGKLVRRVMAWVFCCKESDAVLKPYTAYSLRIGGAITLHDAGADGLVIAAMGQWRSDVYQVYIRTARHKAMTWTVRMSRGLQAKL